MSQVKYCPRCKQSAALSAPACSGCGRAFKTQFAAPPDDRTMLGPASLTPGVPNYAPTSAATGPLDATERSVSMVWTMVGIGVAALWILGSASAITASVVAEDWEASTYQVVGGILGAWLFSFLVMRLRRLFLTAPAAFNASEVARRRAAYSIGASLGVLALLFAAAGVSVLRAGQLEAERAEAARVAQQQKEEAERRADEIRRAIVTPLMTPPPAFAPWTPPAVAPSAPLPGVSVTPLPSRDRFPVLKIDPRHAAPGPSTPPWRDVMPQQLPAPAAKPSAGMGG